MSNPAIPNCPCCGREPEYETDGGVHHVLYCGNFDCPSVEANNGVEELTYKEAVQSWQTLCRELEKEIEQETEAASDDEPNEDTTDHYER